VFRVVCVICYVYLIFVLLYQFHLGKYLKSVGVCCMSVPTFSLTVLCPFCMGYVLLFELSVA
jgi:hypothetical protein